MRVVAIIFWGLWLAACSLGSPAPSAPARFTTLDELINRQPVSDGGRLSTVGYLYIDSDGARLVDQLHLPANAPLQLDSPAAAQVWIEPDATNAISNTLRQQGSALVVPVQATGQIQGPGHYGSDGRYRYQLYDPQFQPLYALPTDIGGLLSAPQRYTNQLVALEGALLTNASSAVLVERLEPGGAPAPATRQIKLAHPVRDQNVLQQLQRTPNNATAFGRVLIEGFWHNSSLIPLAITPLST